VPASDDSEDDCGEQMECRLAGETEVLGENLPQRHHYWQSFYRKISTICKQRTRLLTEKLLLAIHLLEKIADDLQPVRAALCRHILLL
jgi:hypothetical protein